MATKSNKSTKMDRAGQFINDFMNKYKTSRKYVQLTIHKFLYLELVVTVVDNETKAVLFVRGAEQTNYWLDKTERHPLVVKMLKAGMKQTIIAKCLKLSYSTIHNDVRWLRDNTDLLDNVTTLRARRPKLHVVKGRVQRSTEHVPAGTMIQ